MTIYEEKMKVAKDNDKVVFYDYLMYKRESGWWTGLINDDWHRPLKSNLQKARYNAEFLQNLPNYYFLGIPIKEFLKSSYSGGHCHSCVLALSLYFDEFEIITCNLLNYVDHWNKKAETKIKDFEHTFLLVNIDGIKTVIDTTSGMITDFDTYKDIFNIDDVKIITSKEIKDTEIYKNIENKKNIIGPSYNSGIKDDDEYKKYKEEIKKHMTMCKEYKNENNIHLQNFMNDKLYKTSNSSTFCYLRSSLEFKHCNHKFKYPTYNMFSLEDDEFDNILYSECKDTIIRNNMVLTDYHMPKEDLNDQKSTNKIKNKVLSFIKGLGF